MADKKMNARQQAACARLILEITRDYHCALTIERDEVTVYEDIPHSRSQHSHHGGPNLYERLSQALGAAKVYAETRDGTDTILSERFAASAEWKADAQRRERATPRKGAS